MTKLIALIIALLFTASLALPQGKIVGGKVVGGKIAGAAGGGGWTLIANTSAQASNTITVTTSGINTTGADLIVMVIGNYSNTPLVADISDSKSNTWNILTAHDPGGDAISTIAWTRATSVGTAHTFTFNRGGNTTYPAICVAAFSGSNTSPADQQNGNYSLTVTSLATGSITPTANGALLIAGLATGAAEGSTPAIDLSFSITNNSNFSAGVAIGSHLAWKTQTTAAAINPTWSWTNSIAAGTAIASFKAP